MSLLKCFRSEMDHARYFASAGFYRERRPAAIRALGVMLHPKAITNAWYASDCGSVSSRRRVRVRWAISRFLRGANGRTLGIEKLS